jgi:cytochrome P450
VAPDEALVYRDWVIPPGTPVGMTPREMQLDPEVYEDPTEFKPERWLQPNTDKMYRNFIPFGRGNYACIGMNLAWVELYVVLAVAFRRRNFKLYDTYLERDIHIIRDCFVGEVSLETKGVRITYA